VKAAEILFTGLFVVVGAIYALLALNMPRGQLSYPGPGFFPLMVGAFLLLMAVGCFLQAIFRREAGDAAAGEAAARAPAQRAYAKTVQLLLLLVAYGVALKPLGFPIALFGFLLLAIRIFGYRRWGMALLITTVIAVLSYIAFVEWLKVFLPLGILHDLLVG